MMKMKHNKEFEIKIEAGTNVKMTKEEFLKDVINVLTLVEQIMNKAGKVRFHIEFDDQDLLLAKKWTPERTEQLVEDIKNLGGK